MKTYKKITSVMLSLVLIAALSCTVLASSIGMGGAGMNVGESGGGTGGNMSGGNMNNGMGDTFDMSMTDDPNSSTLGDLDGDGVIENENGMGYGLTDNGNNMGGNTADDGMLDTTNNGRSGVDPISDTTAISEDTTDSAMSWTAIIVAVLLAAALIAVVIALIPKKNRD